MQFGRPISGVGAFDGPRLGFLSECFQRIQAMFPWYAPPKTNMEPKNGGLEDNIPFQLGDF